MTALVFGGGGSGKSARAEELAVSLKREGGLFYLATMDGSGNEAASRIERHRALRNGKGFITIEQPRDLGEILERHSLEGGTVLLECLSNLAANEMFPPGGDAAPASEEFLFDKISAELSMLEKACLNLVIVSNDIFREGFFLSPDSSNLLLKNYISLLARLHGFAAERADLVIEVAAGIRICRKGAL